MWRGWLALAVLLTAFLATPAWAACDKDTIDTLSDDGDLIVLTSGGSYDVDPGDQSTASGWSEGDDVLVCGNKIIDKDQGGERVEVREH
jgi:hypothetical protein